MFRIEVVGKEALLSRLRSAPYLIVEALNKASARTEIALREILLNTFETAAALAGEGFPEIYTAHLLAKVSSVNITTIRGASIEGLEFNFEQLGTYDDFSEGFHYGAMMDSGEQVSLPYTGQPLKNEIEARYAYWLMLSDTWGGKIPATHSLIETYAARVAYWDTKGVAPQWLLLNYGQGEYAPYVTPYPIIETISMELDTIFSMFLNEEIDKILRREYTSNYVATYYSYTPSSNRMYYSHRDARGRFAKA